MICHRKNRNNSYSRLLIIVGVFITVVLLFSWLLPKTFPYFAHVIATPVWKSGQYVANTASYAFRFLEPKQSILDENDGLRQRVAELERKEFSYISIANENQKLKNITEVGLANKMIVRVLAKPPVTPFDTLTVEKGGDSLSLGDPVLSQEGYLIGEVSGIVSGDATVKMFSNPGTELPAYLDRNGIEVILVGDGGGNFSIELPKNVDIKDNDLIVSRVADKLIPIALIVSTEIKDGDPLAYFKAHSLVNIFELTHVVINHL
jgi:cell shape-determining protein MreC